MNPFLNPYPQQSLDQVMKEIRGDFFRKQRKPLGVTLRQRSKNINQSTGKNVNVWGQRQALNPNTFGERTRTMIRTSSIDSFYSIKYQRVRNKIRQPLGVNSVCRDLSAVGEAKESSDERSSGRSDNKTFIFLTTEENELEELRQYLARWQKEAYRPLDEDNN